MTALTGIGALLNGMTDEAQKVHAERYQQEQADRDMAFKTLTFMIQDPSIGDPQTKEWALHELRGRTLGTLFPDDYNHKPNKVGKLVDQFVGMSRPQGPTAQGQGMQPPGSQAGVGRGNAQPTQLGAMQGGPPPPPQGQSQPNYTVGGQPPSGGDQQALGNPPPSPMSAVGATGGGNLGFPSPQEVFDGQDITQNFRSPAAQAYTNLYNQAQTDSLKNTFETRDKIASWNIKRKEDPIYSKMADDDPALMEAHERHMSGMVTPVAYAKNAKGSNISYEEALAVSRQTGIPMPEGAEPGHRFQTFNDLKGNPKEIQFGAPIAPKIIPNMVDPTSSTGVGAGIMQPGETKPSSSVATVSNAEPSRIPLPQQLLQALATEKGKAAGSSTALPLSSKEIAKAGQTIAASSAQGRLPSEIELATARGEISKDVGEARTARTEVAKVYEPMRQGTLLAQNMRDAYNRIHSGKSTAPGADDMILLANHIAMTFGGVPGARVGEALIKSHEDAIGYLNANKNAISQFPVFQRAWDRITNQGQLEEGQRQEFLKAADDRLDEIQHSYEMTKQKWGYTPSGERPKAPPSTTPAAPPENDLRSAIRKALNLDQPKQ